MMFGRVVLRHQQNNAHSTRLTLGKGTIELDLPLWI